MNWIITGDADNFQDCLVRVCSSEEDAKATLRRMLVSPTEEDKKLMDGHYNFRIEEVKGEV